MTGTQAPMWMIRRLRDVSGWAEATIRWNEEVSRWEFVLPNAAMQPQSQFLGYFDQPADPESGLFPFRELDAEAFEEVLRNIQATHLANRHDGAGTVRRDFNQRYRFNKDLERRQYQAAGQAFQDMFEERHQRIRGVTQEQGADLTPSPASTAAAATLVIPSVVGGRGQRKATPTTSPERNVPDADREEAPHRQSA